jgi:hypothetical protein
VDGVLNSQLHTILPLFRQVLPARIISRPLFKYKQRLLFVPTSTKSPSTQYIITATKYHQHNIMSFFKSLLRRSVCDTNTTATLLNENKEDFEDVEVIPPTDDIDFAMIIEKIAFWMVKGVQAEGIAQDEIFVLIREALDYQIGDTLRIAIQKAIEEEKLVSEAREVKAKKQRLQRTLQKGISKVLEHSLEPLVNNLLGFDPLVPESALYWLTEEAIVMNRDLRNRLNARAKVPNHDEVLAALEVSEKMEKLLSEKENHNIDHLSREKDALHEANAWKLMKKAKLILAVTDALITGNNPELLDSFACQGEPRVHFNDNWELLEETEISVQADWEEINDKRRVYLAT